MAEDSDGWPIQAYLLRGYGMSTMTRIDLARGPEGSGSNSGVYLPRPPLESSCRREPNLLECLTTPPTPEPAVASQIIHHLLPPRARGTAKRALRSFGEVG